MSLITDIANPVTVTISDSKDIVTITGYCDGCGRCCKPPVMRHPKFIIENTPVTDRSIYDGRCRYLTDLNKCELFIAEVAANGSLDDYPAELVKYWRERCKPWPTYDGTMPIDTLKRYIADGAFENCAFIVTIKPVTRVTTKLEPMTVADKLVTKLTKLTK